jgi:hypothetical protein
MSSRNEPGKLLALHLLVGAALRDDRLSRATVACLWAIGDRINDSGVAWPKLETIAEDARVNRASAVRAVSLLCEHGYLIRESGGAAKSNRYRLGSAIGADLHRCNPAPKCKDAPVEPTTGAELHRCNPEPSIGADLHLALGATLHLEPASLNLLQEPEELSLAALDDVAQDDRRFTEFWTAYPRKTGSKAKALGLWRRKQLDRIADLVIANVTDRTQRDRQWQDKQFIPHPETFLRNERWQDEWQPSPARAGAAGMIPRDQRSEAEIDAENDRELARFNLSGGTP